MEAGPSCTLQRWSGLGPRQAHDRQRDTKRPPRGAAIPRQHHRADHRAALRRLERESRPAALRRGAARGPGVAVSCRRAGAFNPRVEAKLNPRCNPEADDARGLGIDDWPMTTTDYLINIPFVFIAFRRARGACRCVADPSIHSARRLQAGYVPHPRRRGLAMAVGIVTACSDVRPSAGVAGGPRGGRAGRITGRRQHRP